MSLHYNGVISHGFLSFESMWTDRI